MKITDFTNKFFAVYGESAAAIMSAPGRVNLIGEHTDYNQGFVLPCAIDFKNMIAYRLRSDNQVNVVAINYADARDSFCSHQEIAHSDMQWANYVRSVAYVLQKRGYQLSGVDMLMYGDVPQGAGLSSSAALEVCVGGVFNDIANLQLSATDIALIGQQAENEFIGCQSGIMDQFISANGREHSALLIDCQDISSRQIAMPKDLSVIIVNSNYKRELVDSEYNRRREECELAAKAMNVDSLRDATLAMLTESKAKMSEVVFKRARHVVTENERTLLAVKALQENDFETLKVLINESHDSLRDDFEVTVPATDGLVTICREAVGELGAARMTGGGFGGCIICLCRPEKVDDVINSITEYYTKAFNLTASIFVCKASEGMHKVTL